MNVLIAGCGWLGREVGRALVARGDRVVGVRRTARSAAALADDGIEPLGLDLAERSAAAAIPRAVDAVLACPAPAERSVAGYRRTYVEVQRTLFEAAAAAGARSYVYTGSTGVFGQRDGGEVDEDTPPAPDGPTAEVLVEAERLVLDAAGSGVPACLVRLSGLYGPGRTGLASRVLDGTLALGPGDDRALNFCRLEDAARFVIAALDRGRPGARYHGSDAAPASLADFVRWIAARAGIEPPRRSAEPSGGRRRADRRISSARTRRELGIDLEYPSFREGFADLLPLSERR